jgi:hypothetical protein
MELRLVGFVWDIIMSLSLYHVRMYILEYYQLSLLLDAESLGRLNVGGSQYSVNVQPVDE